MEEEGPKVVLKEEELEVVMKRLFLEGTKTNFKLRELYFQHFGMEFQETETSVEAVDIPV